MKKKQNPKKEVHQLILGKQRTQQVEQGYFDGRFVQRAEPSKKIYRREKNERWGAEWRMSLVKFELFQLAWRYSYRNYSLYVLLVRHTSK